MRYKILKRSYNNQSLVLYNVYDSKKLSMSNKGIHFRKYLEDSLTSLQNKRAFDLRYEEMFPYSFKSRKLSDYRYVKKELASGEFVFESDNPDEIDDYLLDLLFIEELKK